jgi:uncharacterized membrane protein
VFFKASIVQREFSPKLKFFHQWSLILLILIVVLGVGLRSLNLDKKIYWHDEVYTSLRITGHTGAELKQQMFMGQVVDARALLKYQQLDPRLGLMQALHSMATEDAQHPPLYFLTLRFWVQTFGNSVAVIRSLSVLISLLLFPAIYWLCQELFAASAVGWMAIALTAVSPLNLWLAQDAREYGLWMVMVTVSSAALLRALRLKTKLSWGLYAVAIALGLYSYLLTGLVMLSHGIYVLVLERFHLNKTTRNYLIASGMSAIAIIPWLLVVIQNFEAIQSSTGWLKNSLPFPIVLQIWILNASRLFLDFDLKLENLWAYGLTLPIVVLEIYAFYWLCRRTPPKIYWFVLTLSTVTALYLVLPDFIAGGQRSVVTRYLMPCYLGMQLAIAYLLVTKMSGLRAIQQRVWQAITLGLISIGIASCMMNAQAETWWNRDISYHHAEMAHVLNQKSRPLVISDAYGMNPGNLISLSYLLAPKVQYLLLPEVGRYPQPAKIPAGFSDVFLLNLPDTYRNQFAHKNRVKLAPVISELWKVN